ncbi:unnamed protein product [Pleuronectes platessa]|uniref:Chemokine interleukin-8-like domain-containing protein n=1 Tax=Pleuronectes platessa TaxID=8262 RepID=A0A9N7YSF7_PLEPL|nr:chemokine (C-X-C motif) ligand 18b [Pleuronectes platessa]CAB1435253.1 unnamed protein product [Pleuronectes platessa]
MALSQRSGILQLFVAAAVCIQLYQAHDFFGRCSCSSSIKFTKGNMSDFQVLENQPGCDRTELIVTMTGPDNSTELLCLDTQGRMAQAFLKCWQRINKDNSRKMECINKKRKAE